MEELMVSIKGGYIQNRTESATFFRRKADGDYRLRLYPYRVRTLDQNEYYWAVVVPLVRDGLIELGHDDVKNDADAHLKMKNQFIGKVDPDFFSLLEKRKLTTTTLCTIQFSNYLEMIFQWSAEYLCVPIPNPVYKSVSNESI
jgi:hypothetical protein